MDKKDRYNYEPKMLDCLPASSANLNRCFFKPIFGKILGNKLIVYRTEIYLLLLYDSLHQNFFKKGHHE